MSESGGGWGVGGFAMKAEGVPFPPMSLAWATTLNSKKGGGTTRKIIVFTETLVSAFSVLCSCFKDRLDVCFVPPASL